MTSTTWDSPDRPNWDRIERYMGQGALTQLAQKKVAVIGLGSGGGFVALSLAMSGVGQFILIDDDIVEATNVVRHVADLRYLHQPKAEALQHLILQRNPNAHVEAISGRIEQHRDALKTVDLVVVGVDGEQSKYAINGICRELGLTAIYAGVYERGEGGDVVVIQPTGEGPCYACWAEQLREDINEANPGATQLDYGMIGADGTIAAEPGLWLHVVRVASAQADLALNELLIGQPIHRTYPANTVIMANVPLEVMTGVVMPPYSAQWVAIRKNPTCMVCGQQEGEESLSLAELLGEDPDALDQADSTIDAQAGN